MTRRPTIFDVAEYFGLGIEFAHELPDTVHGVLAPAHDPQFIMVNAKQPAPEQRFTIAHEIGHYVLHHKARPITARFRLLNRRWRWPFANKICRFARGAYPAIFPKEHQADLWAMAILLQFGDSEAIEAHLASHRWRLFWLLALVASGVAQRFKRTLTA